MGIVLVGVLLFVVLMWVIHKLIASYINVEAEKIRKDATERERRRIQSNVRYAMSEVMAWQESGKLQDKSAADLAKLLALVDISSELPYLNGILAETLKKD